MESFWQKLLGLVTSGGLTLLKVLAIFVIGYLAIKLVMKILNKLLLKTKLEKIAISFINSILKFSLNLLLVLIILQTIGVSITGFIAVLSAAGLAVSLALQDSLSNLANGLIIISSKYFNEGDYIKIGDIEGKVLEIHMLTTKISTTDNKLVTIPNSEIVTKCLINYSSLPSRRVDLSFYLSYEADLVEAMKTVREVMLSNGKVYTSPEPSVDIDSLDDSMIKLFVTCHVDGEDYWDVYYYINYHVLNEFKKKGLKLARQKLEVNLEKESALPFDAAPLPERKEKRRKKKAQKEIFNLKWHKKKNKNKK